MHLFRDYGRFVNPAIHVIWFLLMIVGLSSAYFHATLSLIGKYLNIMEFKNVNILIRILLHFNRAIIRWASNFMGIYGWFLYVLSKKVLSKYFTQWQKTFFYVCYFTNTHRNWSIIYTSCSKCICTDVPWYSSFWIFNNWIEKVKVLI